VEFDLTSLSARDFQQLVQALALKEFGHLLTPLGDGGDGGRDAEYYGRVRARDDKQPWDGHLGCVDEPAEKGFPGGGEA
jgi:hypothetical protein